MSFGLEIQIIAIITSVACSILGVFLMLRGMTMIIDSITHTILLGIVIAFLITNDLKSPLLLVFATITGVFTVWLTELLVSSKIVTKDSSISIIFPLLFSIAIILISKFARNTHLCVDTVLLGEIAYAPFDRLVIMGVSIGAKSIYLSGALLILNLAFVGFFYKELKLVTFDSALALSLGFSPVFFHYALMTMVSATTVVAFEIVGSILVIAFMVGPPITAYLLTDDLKKIFFLSAFFGVLSSVVGYQIARFFDISIAGTIASVIGAIFGIIFVFSPKKGLISLEISKKKQKLKFEYITLLIHIYKHQNTEKEIYANGINSIGNHLSWEQKKLEKLLDILMNEEKVILCDGVFKLTLNGANFTEEYVSDLLKLN